MNILDFIYGCDKNVCPRCGRKMSNFPALSRRIDVEICNNCGREEAFKDWQHIADPIRKWKCVTEGGM